MILFISDRRIYADFFIQNIKLFLNYNVEQCMLKEKKIDNGLDLIIIDGNILHQQSLKKIIKNFKCSKIILISDKNFQNSDVSLIVKSDCSVSKIADYCQIILNQPVQKSFLGLNNQEEILLGALLKGMSNKQIARRYNLAISTVKYHLSRLYEKMGVCNRTQAALMAREFIL